MYQEQNRFVIAQFPNRFLWAMMVAWPISYFTTGYWSSLARAIFYAAAVVWAYEEIVHGVNWFRKLLGTTVMVLLIVGISAGLNH